MKKLACILLCAVPAALAFSACAPKGGGWRCLNGFEYTLDSQISKAGITCRTRVSPYEYGFASAGLFVNGDARCVKSGKSLRVMLYGDAAEDLGGRGLGWRPSVTIKEKRLAKARFIEIDLFYRTVSESPLFGDTLPRSDRPWTICFVVLLAGADRIFTDSYSLIGGWNTLRLDLSAGPPKPLAKADAVAIEFTNESGEGQNGARYHFYLDDLRAVYNAD